MLKMRYVKDRFKVPEVLARDSYRGYEYVVINYGVHPCSYVAIAKGQPYYNVATYEDVDLDCHGGCTYVEDGYSDIFSSEFKVLGWDYAHFDDYSGTYAMSELTLSSLHKYNKKWTTEEMVQDCEDFIDQLYILEHCETIYA